MKKILIIILTLFFIQNIISFTYAATATPTPNSTATPTLQPKVTSEDEIEKIQKIKDMVASRVAELKIVEKRGILGNIKEVSNTQIMLEDLSKETRIIDIDELTKFQSGTSKSFGVSDLKQGDLVSFIGSYNKETGRLLARFISIEEGMPQQFEGIVLSKDTKNYTFSVVNNKGETKTMDVGTSTKIKSYSQKENLVKSGFSKIQAGQRILATGFFDSKDKNLLLADRIIYFTELPGSPEMKKYQNTVTIPPTPIPTTSE